MAYQKELFFFTLAAVSLGCRANLEDTNPYRHRVFLDPQRKYQLEWLADWDTRRVSFNVTVQTTGYVGFGLSRKGKMSGADIVIGGVRRNGTPYFSDRHAIGNQLPVEDDSQDWTLHQAWQRNNRTFLSFSRAFDTCDVDHDLPITNDLSVLIWAYGETDDEFQYHFEHRGKFNAYLLDPDLVPAGLDKIGEETTVVSPNVSIFRMTRNIRLPAQDTLYMCSFHRIPTRRKQHVIGLRTTFPTEHNRRYVHHLLIYRCRAPPGEDPVKFFEGASRSGGSECYNLDQANPLPVSYCRETIYGWGLGGQPIFFPDHVGIPMSETDLEQYFMLQVHYDNPNAITNTAVSVSLELFYTENLRQHDIGLIQLGNIQPGSTSLLLPPGDPAHVVHGHCAPGCTERILGPLQGPAMALWDFPFI